LEILGGGTLVMWFANYLRVLFVARVHAEKKNKKKKKKKTKEIEGVAAADQVTSSAEKQNLSINSEKKGKKQTETKPSQVRTFPNGLVIEELLMGKPDGKKAAPGKKVTLHLQIF